MKVAEPPRRGDTSPDFPPDAKGSDRGSGVVTSYPERASNPHPAKQEGILSPSVPVSGSVRNGPDRGETGNAAGPERGGLAPNGDRSFPEMSPDRRVDGPGYCCGAYNRFSCLCLRGRP